MHLQPKRSRASIPAHSRAVVAALVVFAQLAVVPLHALHHHDEHDHGGEHHHHPVLHDAAAPHASTDCVTCHLIAQSRLGFAARPVVAALCDEAIEQQRISPTARPPSSPLRHLASPRAPPRV